MLIIADENIEHALIEKLKEHFEVNSIYQSHRGSTDDEIAIIATQKNVIILTEDKDFGDLLFIHNQAHLSVYNDTKNYHHRRRFSRKFSSHLHG